jgi:hypothetical protein
LVFSILGTSSISSRNFIATYWLILEWCTSMYAQKNQV